MALEGAMILQIYFFTSHKRESASGMVFVNCRHVSVTLDEECGSSLDMPRTFLPLCQFQSVPEPGTPSLQTYTSEHKCTFLHRAFLELH